MNDQSPSYGIVLVTASSKTEAQTIASALLEEFLAACVSITPVHSLYRWEGKINSDEEWQLIIKTDLNQFTALSATISQLHSYEVPEIIALPIIAGSPDYLNWIGENCRQKS